MGKFNLSNISRVIGKNPSKNVSEKISQNSIRHDKRNV